MLYSSKHLTGLKTWSGNQLLFSAWTAPGTIGTGPGVRFSSVATIAMPLIVTVEWKY